MRGGKNIFCLIFSLGLFLLSCNQKNSNPPVLGQWKVVSFNFDSTNRIYKEMTADDIHDMKAIATGFAFDFKKNNTYIITHRHGETDKGTFKITGKDKILMTPKGDTTQTIQILLLDKETLILKDIKRGYIYTLKKI